MTIASQRLEKAPSPYMSCQIICICLAIKSAM